MSEDDQNTSYLSKSIDKLESAVEKIDEKCGSIDTSLLRLTDRFDSHLAQDEAMYVEFKRMVDILSENTQDIKHHIARTDMLQDDHILLKELCKMIDVRLSVFEQDKIKKQAIKEFQVEVMKKWGKIFAVVASIVTLTYYLIKIKTGM